VLLTSTVSVVIETISPSLFENLLNIVEKETNRAVDDMQTINMNPKIDK
jgi:hypothetical protein